MAGPLTCLPRQLGAGFSSLPKPSATPSRGFHALCETPAPAHCSPHVSQPCSEVQNYLVTLLQRLLGAPGSGFILPVQLRDGTAGAPSQTRKVEGQRSLINARRGSCGNGLGRGRVDFAAQGFRAGSLVWNRPPDGTRLVPRRSSVLGSLRCLGPSVLSSPFLCHREVTLPLAPRSRCTLGAGGRMDAPTHGEVCSSPARLNPNCWIYTGKFFIFDFFKRCMTSIG